jgi:cytochrome oxidase Cu insertion factor (SCO1/SenC/PrrC family)
VPPSILCLLMLCLPIGLAGVTHAEGSEDIRALPLLDQDGAVTSSRAFDGKTFVLNFIFTRCMELCHLQVRSLMTVRESLPAEVRARVQFVSVSIDPEQDTPETLRQYARAHRIVGTDWRFATASPEIIDQLTHLLGVKRQVSSNGQIDHSVIVFLFDARGRLVQRYAGSVEPSRLAREIREVVTLFDTQQVSR